MVHQRLLFLHGRLIALDKDARSTAVAKKAAGVEYKVWCVKFLLT